MHSIRAWGARHRLLVDALLAVVLTLLFTLWMVDGRSAVKLLLVAGLTLPLTLRRRAPLLTFGTIALVAFVQWLTKEVLSADLTLLIALYSVAAYERRRWGVLAAIAIFELGCALAATRYAENEFGSFVALSAFVVAAAALGTYVRTRREHIAALLLRAGQLERERDRQAQLATAAERARIARELHDVVAHNLTVMIALADGARLTAAQSPAEADAAMRDVSATGREALGEMRRLLGVLREPADGDGDAEPQPLRPQPGLDQLDALLEQVRGAGLATRLTRTGEPFALSPGAQLTVFRFVQEALTNTLKHARSASSAEVRLHYGGDVLALEVTDDGVPQPAANAAEGAGHGIAGMRERAAAYGAEVEAGPGPDGGWRVSTRLRLDDGAAR